MFEPSLLEAWGLPGLFLAAFLAGSIVSAPSEAVLAALVSEGASPGWSATVATLGNLLGAVTVFALGRWLHEDRTSRLGRWLERGRQQAGHRFERAATLLRRWGSPLLLLSWLPFVGALLVLAAGALGVRAAPFVLFAGLGKGLRYFAVAHSVAAAL